MREYDLYLFDFDNTLYDTRYGIQEILRHALPAVGVEYRDDMFPEFCGLSMEQVYDRFVDDPEKHDLFVQEFMRIVATDVYRNAKPFPETAEVLRELKSRGKHIGIASGKTKYKIVVLLDDFGLGDIPERIVGYNDTERHKPFPDPILLAMSHFDKVGRARGELVRNLKDARLTVKGHYFDADLVAREVFLDDNATAPALTRAIFDGLDKLFATVYKHNSTTTRVVSRLTDAGEGYCVHNFFKFGFVFYYVIPRVLDTVGFKGFYHFALVSRL